MTMLHVKSIRQLEMSMLIMFYISINSEYQISRKMSHHRKTQHVTLHHSSLSHLHSPSIGSRRQLIAYATSVDRVYVINLLQFPDANSPYPASIPLHIQFHRQM